MAANTPKFLYAFPDGRGMSDAGRFPSLAFPRGERAIVSLCWPSNSLQSSG